MDEQHTDLRLTLSANLSNNEITVRRERLKATTDTAGLYDEILDTITMAAQPAPEGAEPA